jgi:hypothetical protein
MAPTNPPQMPILDTIVMCCKQELYPAFLLNGNTGQDGLSWQDNDKFGGGD